MCRKAATTEKGGSIEVWGPGSQTRSFLYIDECIDATQSFMRSNFTGPVNIGSEEMIAINDFAKMAIAVSGKNIGIHNIDGKEFEKKYGHPCPIGVNGRNSDNTLFEEKMGWKVKQPLLVGMRKTYEWINTQVKLKQTSPHSEDPIDLMINAES
jgi:nucleoside-diphosphate-sugar epimerase